MAKNKQEIIEKDGLKYKIEYVINLKYSPETVKLLKKRKIPYTIWKNTIIIEDEEDELDSSHYVPIEEELSDKLYQISKITGISVKEMISEEIRGLLFDHAAENPYIFLENFLGFENVKDPLSIVKQLQPILNIPEKYMKELETTDPIEYLKKWNPLKYK